MGIATGCRSINNSQPVAPTKNFAILNKKCSTFPLSYNFMILFIKLTLESLPPAVSAIFLGIDLFFQMSIILQDVTWICCFFGGSSSGRTADSDSALKLKRLTTYNPLVAFWSQSSVLLFKVQFPHCLLQITLREMSIDFRYLNIGVTQ